MPRCRPAGPPLGIAFYLVTLFVIRRSRDLERYRYVILLIGGLLLVAPLLPVFGKDVNGARLWVGVGSMIVQPVEGAKLLLCIYFASYFAANKEILSIPTARIGRRLYLDPRPLLPILLAWVVSIAIIGAENDIAFAFLLFALFIGLLWITTGRTVYLLGGLGLFALGAFIASRLFSQVHERVVIWLHASQYPSGAGYQLVQSWYSLAAGGVGGTGLGRGTSAEYLHGYVISDLVFTGISEELGLVGAVCTIVAFVLIVGSGLRIAQIARSDFSRLLATGLTLLLGLQAFPGHRRHPETPALHGDHLAVRRVRRIVTPRQLRPDRRADADLGRGRTDARRRALRTSSTGRGPADPARVVRPPC